ncbi:MAG: hypothetical protein WBP59_03605 [Ilumatobacteraceae bacterium]
MAARSAMHALQSIHDELWDPDRGMARYARGVTPGVDISALGLHSVRETALGALLDLQGGDLARAATALRNVLELQYPISAHPWSGTFPVAAEQPEPPGDDAIEWVHYDPNWRQFLGCILALAALHHGESLPADITAGITAALARCAAGEPEERIAEWYTNPNLMHAWLLAHVGRLHGDDDLAAAGERRARRCVERFERFGDVDEYNSPTYDGIDLFALGLWVAHPPSPAFEQAGNALLAGLGSRITTLFDPELATTCGPYIRAYGITLARYVSLTGLWIDIATQIDVRAGTILPPTLDQDTDHVHDLYFLPALQLVAPAVLPHLDVRPVTAERSHQQSFGRAHAESLLRPGLAIGWDHGRRHQESLDQYVPFSAHVLDHRTATISALGVMLPDETAWIDCRRVDDLRWELRAQARADSVGLRLVGTSRAGITNDVEALRAVFGPAELRFDVAATTMAPSATHYGDELHLTWSRSDIRVEILVHVDGAEPGSTSTNPSDF